MDYNPYTKEQNQLSDSIARKKSDRDNLIRDLSWYQSTSMEELTRSLEKKELSLTNLRKEVSIIENEIKFIETDIQRVKSNTKTILNPFSWFDNEQQTNRSNLSRLKSNLEGKKRNLLNQNKMMSEINSSISTTKSTITKYKNIDTEKLQLSILELDNKISQEEKKLSNVSSLKKQVDDELRPLLNRLSSLESEASSHRTNIIRAESFQDDLDVAENSYERAMTHQECESEFGSGNPQSVIRRHQSMLRRVEKEIETTRKNAETIGKNVGKSTVRNTGHENYNSSFSRKDNEKSKKQSKPEDAKKPTNSFPKLYIDFIKNRDDHSNQKGNLFQGLESQIIGLRNVNGNSFLGYETGNKELLGKFIDAFFPENLNQSYFISNLSVKDKLIFLSIRPKIIGPRLEQLLPHGRSLAITGRLWDNKKDVDNPVFLVQNILQISHSDKRNFEKEISCFVYSREQDIYPGNKRSENILSKEFIENIPLISVKTRNNLENWRSYLDWRERLIHARLIGLRYIRANVTDDGRVCFLTVSDSKDKFDLVRRVLRNDELNAYSLNYSKDPWEFEFNDRHRGRGTELGDFAGLEENVQNSIDTDIEGIPWKNPFFSDIYFRLPEDAQNEFEDILNAGGTIEEASKSYLNDINSNGFLALSAVGDIMLVNRQRTELQQLQEQSGYAPFLSSYLFDIKAANEPTQLKDIPDDQWLQTSLNNDQRLAVQKMISTPDLAMVQGPPGTGKTTMIAEATWQFIREGKKVLLVSQASLAVNNALERLSKIPEIRAIRLSRRERKNEREHPYSQENALGTYYQSIADTCKKRTMDVWNHADSLAKQLNDWITSYDLVSKDLNTLRNKSEEINKNRLSLQEELTQIRETNKLFRDIEKQKNNIDAFKLFIKGDDVFPEVLPDQILLSFFDNIISVFDSLIDSDIRINNFWHQPEYGSALERTRYAVEAILNWRKTLSIKHQLLGDIERLKVTDGNSVLSPDTELLLVELQRKLDATQKAMIEDGSLVSEWQSIQKDIREIKRQGSGLDRNIYSQLLNTPDSEILRKLTISEADRSEVISELTKINEILTKVDAELTKGIDVVYRVSDSYLDSMTVVSSVDKEKIHHLEARLRLETERQNEIVSEISSKNERLNEIVKKFPKTEQSVDLTTLNMTEIHAIAVDELSTLERQIDQNKTFRESWGDLIEEWVKDLTNKDTIRSDHDNFLNTYTSSCNVVGVTCTENRQTLEEVGHSWFDVVIVDEVSKATPTEILMPLMMAKTAILVGDHRQLPPLFKEHEGSWEEAIADQEENTEEDNNADSDLTAENFDRFRTMVTSSLFKEHFENAPDSLKSFLFTQYRMHPQIMRVVNQFYENRLDCGLADPDGTQSDSDPKGHRLHGLTLVGENSHRYIVPERHVAWLDSSLDPYQQLHYERRDLGSSKVNELECVLIAKTLCDIEMSCRDLGFGENSNSRKEVGIVTFYGRQVRAIKDAIRRIQSLRKINFIAIKFDINTVDRYQGQERPIILVSMVRNPPFKLSQKANTAQFERINVAFSRAQELLIIAGAKDVFSKYPVMLPHLDRAGNKKIEVYRYIIDEIQRNGGLWSSGDIVSAQEYNKLLPADYSPKMTGGLKSKFKKQRKGRK